MNDRELLERAAKAAGVKFHAGAEWDRYGGLRTLGGWWNPLTDDRDALRLAVKLKLIVHADVDAQGNVAARDGSEWFIEPTGSDSYAATRRAIVRAAAAIGEQMP